MCRPWQRLGLATDRAPFVMQAADGSIVEVFEWASADAVTRAHHDAEVLALCRPSPRPANSTRWPRWPKPPVLSPNSERFDHLVNALPPALVAATARDERRRLPFEVDGSLVGSVARRHLPLLARHAGLLAVDEHQVELRAGPDASRDAGLARLHRVLRDAGAIAAWRNETIVLPDPVSLATLALIERAAARFWGTLTFGAHLNGYLVDDRGRPTRLWIARRSPSKATDPGLFDNLVGGGVAAGQSPLQALIREAHEEAGLLPAQMASLRTGPCCGCTATSPKGGSTNG